MGLPVDRTELLGVPQLFVYAGDLEAYNKLRDELKSLDDEPSAVAIRGQLVGDVSEAVAAELAERVELMLSAALGHGGNAGAGSAKGGQAASTLSQTAAARKYKYSPMYYSANLYVAGWAHLRAGNIEKAIGRLEESNKEENQWFGRGIGYPLLAIAYHTLGRTEEALRSFEQSQILLERLLDESVRRSTGSPSIPWMDWIEFLINHRQASMVVKGHTPAIDPQLRQLARFADAAIE
jgi:tetratricopeptide (TPR) repeat protein